MGADAVFDDVVNIRAEDIAPSVTGGISPDQGCAVTGSIPTFASLETDAERASLTEAFFNDPTGTDMGKLYATRLDLAC